ncbi:MAG: SUMF1/EgtB/PvdO family nonheme iron enzyme, partial [Blastocatellia bacterium]
CLRGRRRTTWAHALENRYKPYPYRPDDGREDLSQTGVKRVLRGGSWANDHHNARAAYRGIDRPAYRDIVCGFRVVG